MSNILKKIYIFYKNDGCHNTLKYIKNSIQSILFLRTSYTFFFQKKFEKKFIIEKTHKIHLQIVNNKQSYLNLKYERLLYFPFEQWFKDGSVCCIGISNSSVISCIWAHLNSYKIEGVGRCDLNDSEAWIGPSFVDVKYRRKGVNTFQRKFIINYLLDHNIDKLITAVNLNNFPAFSNAFRQDYEVIGIHINKKLFNNTIHCRNLGNFIEKRIEIN